MISCSEISGTPCTVTSMPFTTMRVILSLNRYMIVGLINAGRHFPSVPKLYYIYDCLVNRHTRYSISGSQPDRAYTQDTVDIRTGISAKGGRKYLIRRRSGEKEKLIHKKLWISGYIFAFIVDKLSCGWGRGYRYFRPGSVW